MAVVHHALRWDMTLERCVQARAVATLSRDGDCDRLSEMGEALYRRASGFMPVLAAFGLDDRDHVRSWLAPAAVAPCLVTVLAWLPDMTLLDERAADALAVAYRSEGSPVAALAPAGSAFLPLARALDRLFDHGALATRPTAGTLGVWVRADRLIRRLSPHDGDAGAAIVAAVGAAPGDRWLVSTTLW